MISETIIKQVFNELSSYLSLTMIRADQKGNVPPYPFATYKEININEENPYQNNIIVEENATDPTSVDITKYELSETTFSLNFMDRERKDRIKTYARQAFQWFKSIAGIEFCHDRGIVSRLIGTSIDDRTVFMDAYWENRIGFDVRFDYQGGYTQTIEAIETIIVTPTIDGEQKDDITITD